MIDNIVCELMNGNVCILPSDTVYGLAALAYKEECVKKIFELKKRDLNKQMPVHYSNLKDVIEDFECDEKTINLTKILWPGATTIVLKTKINSRVRHLGETVAVRIPNYDVLLKIISKTCPLIMTSANISNKEHLKTYEDIYKVFPLKGIRDDLITSDKPSTIISLVEDIKLIRQGLVDYDYILRQYQLC